MSESGLAFILFTRSSNTQHRHEFLSLPKMIHKRLLAFMSAASSLWLSIGT